MAVDVYNEVYKRMNVSGAPQLRADHMKLEKDLVATGDLNFVSFCLPERATVS